MARSKGRGSSNINFTEGPIMKSLIAFSIPALIGDIFNALYNVVDTIVVGRFVSSNALAAVGSCFAISMVCISVFAGFGMGSGVLAAQMFGAERHDDLQHTVNTAYIGGFFVGTAMIIVGEIITVPVLKLLNTPPEILDMAKSYLRIYFLGCTGQLFYYMGSNMLRGLGDSKWPTYALILCAVLNIVLDLLFVIAFKMSTAGVALATVISQLISGIAVMFRAYLGNYGGVKFDKKTFRLEFRILKMILKIGIPGALQMLVTSIGTLIITAFTNSFGADVVACNAIVLKVEQFALLPGTAVGTALRTFIGQNLGAGNEKRTNEGMKQGVILILAIGLLMGIIVMIFGRPLSNAFVKEEVVIGLSVEALRIIALFFIMHAAQMSLGGVLTGAGATKPVMYISFVGIAVRVAGCYFLGKLTGHWQGLFWATNLFYTVVAAIYLVYIWKGDWKKYVSVRRGPGGPGGRGPGGPAPAGAGK